MEHENESELTAARPKKAVSYRASMLTGIIAAAVVAGGSVYVFERQQNIRDSRELQAQIDTLASQLASVAPTPAPSPTPSPAPTVLPTASATPGVTATATPVPSPTPATRQYSDTTYGYSFTYPSSLMLAEQPNVSAVPAAGTSVRTLTLTPSSGKTYYVNVYSAAFKTSDGPVSSWIDGYYGQIEAGPSHKASTTFNGHTAMTFYMEKAAVGAFGGAIYVAFPQPKTQVYIVVSTSGSQDASGSSAGLYYQLMSDTILNQIAQSVSLS